MDMNEGFDAYLKELENSGSGIAPSQNSFGLDDLFGSDTKLPSNTATLTVKVDVDCNLYIDGDLVDDAIQANQIKKVPVPLGEHIITIESHYHSAITEDREIDIKEVGKNQVLLVKGLQEKERELVLKQLNKQKELVRAEREKEEDRLKKDRLAKEEQENMRKGEEYYNSHIYDLAIQCFEKVLETSENSDAMLYIGKCFYGQGGDDKSVIDYRKAITWFIKAAENGNAKACCELGRCYSDGEGVKSNEQEALKWYRKAAEFGDIDTMKDLAFRIHQTNGFCEEELFWYEKAADLEDTESMCSLGKIFCTEYDYRPANTVDWFAPDIKIENKYYDINQALEWYKKAAGLGDLEAMYTIGKKYYLGEGFQKDLAKAQEWFEKIENIAEDECIKRGGLSYSIKWDGKGSYLKRIGSLFEEEKDYREAIEWYHKAADVGNATACRCIGDMFFDGKGVYKDYSKGIQWYEKAAVMWEEDSAFFYRCLADRCIGVGLKDKAISFYERAADLGLSDALLEMGRRYYYGDGVRKDFDKAYIMFSRSTDDMAKNNLGVMYNLGQGVSKDYKQAMEFYKDAADGMSDQAKANIGRMYFLGEGVPQDYHEALKWYQEGGYCCDWDFETFMRLDVGLPKMEF